MKWIGGRYSHRSKDMLLYSKREMAHVYLPTRISNALNSLIDCLGASAISMNTHNEVCIADS